MKITLNVVLTRPARKEGGDRYECPLNDKGDMYVVYIPQFISREGKNVARETLSITFEGE